MRKITPANWVNDAAVMTNLSDNFPTSADHTRPPNAEEKAKTVTIVAAWVPPYLDGYGKAPGVGLPRLVP